MTKQAIPVFFLLLPDSLLLDWAGPAEALRIANQCLIDSGQAPRFDLRFTGPTVAPSTATRRTGRSR